MAICRSNAGQQTVHKTRRCAAETNPGDRILLAENNIAT